MATSAASTLGDSWTRLPDCNKGLHPQPVPSGARFSPTSLATLDVPQGKVLVAVGDAIVALDLQRLLHKAGYRVAGPATGIAEIDRLIQRGDIDCAILDLDVDRRAPLPMADLLEFADVPFVYLTTGVLGPLPARHRLAPVVGKPFSRDMVIGAVEKAMAKPREVANYNRWPNASVVPWARVYPPL